MLRDSILELFIICTDTFLRANPSFFTKLSTNVRSLNTIANNLKTKHSCMILINEDVKIGLALAIHS